MRQKPGPLGAEEKAGKRHATEEKIRIVLEGLRGEYLIAELCRRMIGQRFSLPRGTYKYSQAYVYDNITPSRIKERFYGQLPLFERLN